MLCRRKGKKPGSWLQTEGGFADEDEVRRILQVGVRQTGGACGGRLYGCLYEEFDSKSRALRRWVRNLVAEETERACPGGGEKDEVLLHDKTWKSSKRAL